MNPKRKAFLAGLAVLSCLAFAVQPVLSAPSQRGPSGGGSPGARPPGGPNYGGSPGGHPSGGRGYSGSRPGHSGHGGYGGSRHGYPAYAGYRGHGGHYGRYAYSGYSGYYGGPYWGWGLGWGVPLGLAWYGSAAWGYPYSPAYAYGPAYPAYGYACAYGDDCWRAAQAEPTPETTVVPPPAPGEEGGPTQRPLHLNYCDSAKAWFPHVRSCPGGWRLIRPEYSPAP